MEITSNYDTNLHNLFQKYLIFETNNSTNQEFDRKNVSIENVGSFLPRISLENDISRILRPSKYFGKSRFLISFGDLPTPNFRASPITHSIYFPRTIIIWQIMNSGSADELYHASTIKTYHWAIKLLIFLSFVSFLLNSSLLVVRMLINNIIN